MPQGLWLQEFQRLLEVEAARTKNIIPALGAQVYRRRQEQIDKLLDRQLRFSCP